MIIRSECPQRCFLKEALYKVHLCHSHRLDYSVIYCWVNAELRDCLGKSSRCQATGTSLETCSLRVLWLLFIGRYDGLKAALGGHVVVDEPARL